MIKISLYSSNVCLSSEWRENEQEQCRSVDKFQGAPVQQEQLFITDKWLYNQNLNDQLD